MIRPFIWEDEILPEVTLSAVIIGVLLSVIFGAAKSYLGQKAVTAISASIPAPVISMGIMSLQWCMTMLSGKSI